MPQPATKNPLLELTVTILIVMVTSGISVGLLTIFKQQQNNNISVQQLNQNASLILQQFNQDLIHGQNIVSGSILGVHPSDVTIELPPNIGEDITIDTYTKNIQPKESLNSVPIRTLRYTKNNTSYDLTNESVTVTDFKVFNRTATNETQNIELTITLASVQATPPETTTLHLSYQLQNS